MVNSTVPTSQDIYRFGQCRFNAATFELTREGKTVKVQRQSGDLLLYFLRHAGQVLSKDQLLRDVWGNRHLTDSAVTQAVMKVRKAIGDDERQLIRTVHGRGFSFVAAVTSEEIPAPSRPTDPSQRPFIWAYLLMIVLAIAVGWWWIGTEQSPSPAMDSVGKTEIPPRWIVADFTNATTDESLAWIESGLSHSTRQLLTWAATQTVVDTGDLNSGDLAELRRFVGADYALSAIIERQQQSYILTATIYSDDEPAIVRLQGLDLALLTRELVQRCASLARNDVVLEWPSTHDFGDPLVAELYARARDAEANDNNSEAIELLEAAQTRAPENLELKVKLIEASLPQSGHAAAIDKLNALLTEYGDALSGDERARLLHRVGDLSWYMGNIEPAQRLLEQALEATNQNTPPALQGVILNSLSAAVQSSGDLDRAWELATMALNRFRRIGDHYHSSVALTNLGYLADDLGRLDSARQLHSEALTIRQRFDFPQLIAASRYGLARVLRRSGNFVGASELLDQSTPVVRELDLAFDLFDNLEERAEVQRAQAQFVAALTTIEEAGALAEENQDTLGLAWAAGVRGKILRDLGRYSESATATERAIALHLKAEEKHEAAYAQIELAETELARGRITQASELLGQIAKEFPDNSSSNVLLRLNHLEARLHSDPERQISALDQVLRQARAMGAHDLEAFIALDLIPLLLAGGDLARAETVLAIAERWSPDCYRTLAARRALLLASDQDQAAAQLQARLREHYPEYAITQSHR